MTAIDNQKITTDTNIISNSEVVPITVITTCYGRNRHLYNLLTSLASGSKRPAQVIIVNDDADKDKLASFDLIIQQIATYKNDKTNDSQSLKTGFDIGRNRNLGASKAEFDTLVFLDVDCIVSFDFIAKMYDKALSHPQALIMGQPRYLTRPLTDTESQQLSDLQHADNWLIDLSQLNPYRQNMVKDDEAKHKKNITKNEIEQTQDYGAFWSLCFVVSRTQFDAIGGFDTDYVGYGAEDTDFAFTARKLGIDFYLTNHVVYHQQHSVYRPPLNHLASIIVNANIFYQKWQHWAMSGWLKEFSEMGLIDWQDGQTYDIELIREPTDEEIDEAHYPDAMYV